jgi:kynurenine formamidase
MPRWKRRPERANWGDFGADDELGRLNLITPELRKRAAAEVREGIAFCLSLPLNIPGGNVLHRLRHPPRLTALPRDEDGALNYNYPLSKEDPRNTDVVSDDVVTLATQYSTHWDSFAHVGQMFDGNDDGVCEPLYYNGWRGGEHVIPPDPASGAARTTRLGIETLATASLQGRGILIDACHHLGRGRRAVGYDDLMRILDADDIVVERGDMLCFYTGFGDTLLAAKGRPNPADLHPCQCPEFDGWDDRLLRWIVDAQITAIASDNYGVEYLPARETASKRRPSMPLHDLCLFKLGIPLGELWYLSELAAWLRANRRSHFLLTAPPLRLPGAVGSPTTPIATV